MAEIIIKTATTPLHIGTVGVDRGGMGWIYVYDVAGDNGSSITATTYQDTAENVLTEFTIDGGTDCVLSIRSSYPKVYVDGDPQELSLDASNAFFAGTVNLTVPDEGGEISVTAVTPNNGTGARCTLTVTVD